MFSWMISSSLCWSIWKVFKSSLFSLDRIRVWSFKFQQEVVNCQTAKTHENQGRKHKPVTNKANTDIFSTRKQNASCIYEQGCHYCYCYEDQVRDLWGQDSALPPNYILNPWFSVEKRSCSLLQASPCRWDRPWTCNSPASTLRDWDCRHIPGCPDEPHFR